jgi:hypothetical protein
VTPFAQVVTHEVASLAVGAEHPIVLDLVCQRPNQTILAEYVDSGTQDAYPMHVCAPGHAMSGIHVGQNKFNCAR